MKYMDGTEVLEGDVVAFMNGGVATEGVVLEVVLPGTEGAQWRKAPNGGVVIEGGGIGLSFTESLEDDEDVIFVRRGISKP